jgi:hypothetical protein
LEKILEKLPAKENISLYFVVPDKFFDDFKFQNYHNEKGTKSKSVPNSVKMLEQWVLGVPLTESLGDKENVEQSKVQGMKKTAASEDDIQHPQSPKKRAANIQHPQTPNKRTKLNAGGSKA